MGAGKPRSLITGSLLRTLGEVVPNNRTTCSEQFSELLGITGPIARNKKGKQATGSRKAGGWFYKRRLLVFAKQAAGSPSCPAETPFPSHGLDRSCRRIPPLFSRGFFHLVHRIHWDYPLERGGLSVERGFRVNRFAGFHPSILPRSAVDC